MGFLFDREAMLQRLNEVEVNGQEAGDPGAEAPEDYNAPDDTGNEEQPPEDNGTQPPPDDNYGQDPEDQPTDYTDGADDSGGEGGYDDGGYDDGGGGGAPPQEEADSAVDDLKSKEEEIYASLTPEQLDIKHRELKNQYLKMYDTITSLIDRIGEVGISEDKISVIEYISNNLSNLKDMVSDYVSKVYQTKSFIENSINYNRFLAVLSGISKMLEEMEDNSEDDKENDN